MDIDPSDTVTQGAVVSYVDINEESILEQDGISFGLPKGVILQSDYRGPTSYKTGTFNRNFHRTPDIYCRQNIVSDEAS